MITPIEKKDADIEEVFTRLSGAGMSASEETIYKAVGVLRYSRGSYADAADSLEHHLRKTGHPEYEPWLELAWSHLKRKKFTEALAFAREAATRAPEHPRIRRVEAAALYALGQKREGIAMLENQVNRGADQTFRLAVMKSGVGEHEQAIALARAALQLRDNLWIAWRLIGEVEISRKRYTAAASAFFNALAIEPDDDRNRDGIVKSLTALGRADEAADYGK